MCSDSPDEAEADRTDAEEGVRRGDYDICAEVDLTSRAAVLSPSMRTVEDAVVDLEYAVVGDDSRVLFGVRTDAFDRFESALLADATVTDPTHLYGTGDRRVYRATAAAGVETAFDLIRCIDCVVRRVRGQGGTWSLRLRLASRKALVSLRSHCRDRDVEMRVRRLTTTAVGEDTAYRGVTRDQRDLLRLAFEIGYFDVPRRASQRTLAERLDVSSSAISQNLRRATAALISSTVCDDAP